MPRDSNLQNQKKSKKTGSIQFQIVEDCYYSFVAYVQCTCIDSKRFETIRIRTPCRHSKTIQSVSLAITRNCLIEGGKGWQRVTERRKLRGCARWIGSARQSLRDFRAVSVVHPASNCNKPVSTPSGHWFSSIYHQWLRRRFNFARHFVRLRETLFSSFHSKQDEGTRPEPRADGNFLGGEKWKRYATAVSNTHTWRERVNK